MSGITQDDKRMDYMIRLEQRGKTIWAKSKRRPNCHVVFRKSFDLEDVPAEIVAHIAVDTKYWLYVNGELAVFEGGLFRESIPGAGYADSVDIADYLRQGTNCIAIHVWYFGNEGRNSTDSGCGGLMFQCPSLGIVSDETFKYLIHPAYYNTDEPNPSGLYAGHNLGFDATKDLPDIYAKEFDDSGWAHAAILDPSSLGALYLRPVPLIRYENRHGSLLKEQEERVFIMKLPYAMQAHPCIEIEADEGTVIDMRSDRYRVNGGPGQTSKTFNSQRVEYICEKGKNKFESLLCLFGEKIILTCSKPIKIHWAGFRESGYNCDIVGKYECDCEILNTLIKKAGRTLYVCMRDNFMDCPDRERGQWIGDLSVQAPQVFFLLSFEAIQLLKKAIHDFIFLRKDDVLAGNVPGANLLEFPSQSLNAISELGLIATYYKYTGDKEVLSWALEPCVSYLKLWQTGPKGLIEHRSGTRSWFDHLYNKDKSVLENAWYYSALRFAKKMAETLNVTKYDEFLDFRSASIKEGFNKEFWKGKHYSSDTLVDDRANAMAVMAGLCPSENYPLVRDVLMKVFNASIYMENYVLSALCEMGYKKDAYRRMISRYYNLAKNENTTLWEDFYVLGTRNHAWSGAPVNIAFKYFLGIDTEDGFETYTIKPVEGLFKNQSTHFETSKCVFRIQCSDGETKIDVERKNPALATKNINKRHEK